MGSGVGGGDGTGGGLGGAGVDAAGEGSGAVICLGFDFFFMTWRWGVGLELISPPRSPGWLGGLGRCRRGQGLGGVGLDAAAFGAAFTSACSTWTRGNPTSPANGGGAGGFSNEGTTCSASSPTPARATPLPKVIQRIRTPLIPAQDPEPGGFSPQRGKSSSQAKAARSSRPSTSTLEAPRYPEVGRPPSPPDSASR